MVVSYGGRVSFSQFKVEDIFVNEKNLAPTPINVHADTATFASIECVEPLLTIREVASILRWSPDTARRYFKDLPGVLVKHQQRRYKRAYRHYMIPKSVLQREWQRMAGTNGQARQAA